MRSFCTQCICLQVRLFSPSTLRDTTRKTRCISQQLWSRTFLRSPHIYIRSHGCADSCRIMDRATQHTAGVSMVTGQFQILARLSPKLKDLDLVYKPQSWRPTPGFSDKICVLPVNTQRVHRKLPPSLRAIDLSVPLEHVRPPPMQRIPRPWGLVVLQRDVFTFTHPSRVDPARNTHHTIPGLSLPRSQS